MLPEMPTVGFMPTAVKDARKGIFYAAIRAAVHRDPAFTYVYTTRRYTTALAAARYAKTLLDSMRQGLLAEAVELPGAVEMVAFLTEEAAQPNKPRHDA